MLPEWPARYFPANRILIRASPVETELSVVRASELQWCDRIEHPASEDSLTRLRSAIHGRYASLARSGIGLLDNGRLLRTELRLPRAAAGHLEETVGYQIERLSPFLPENTLYGIRAWGDDREGSEISADVIIAPKDYVEGVRERAKLVGFCPISFAIEGVGGDELQAISFAGQERDRGRYPLRNQVLISVCVLFFATVLLAPIVSKHRALATIEDEIVVLKPQAEQAGKLRAEREKHLGLLTKVITLKRSAPAPLGLLAKLAAALDDQTYLFEFRLEGQNVTILGLSRDASALAQRLGAMQDFKSVKFQGAVARDAQTDRERFALALELVSTP